MTPVTRLSISKMGLFWSVRVGLHYRALAVEDDGDILWVWIGTHDAYDRLVSGQRG